MAKRRNLQLFRRLTAGISLVVWIVAFSYCSSLCLLHCAPPSQIAEVEYTHEGCGGHPVESEEDAGCSDSFCESAPTAYASYPEITFLKLDFPELPEFSIMELRAIPAQITFVRQAIPAIWTLTPAVCLDTANFSLAPPLLS